MQWNIVRRLIEESMRTEFRQDILLSGGLDSSVVVAAAKSHSPSIKLRTHTVGWSIKDPSFVYARMIAKKFNTEHYEYFMSEKDIFESIQYARDLQYPDPGTCATQWMIHKQGLKSFMCGEGGDEVFGGYSWHWLAFLCGRFKQLTYRELTKDIPEVLKNKYHGADLGCPLLYGPLIEYVRSLPSRQIIGKQLLKQAYPEVPKEIRNRRKVGFNMPVPFSPSQWRDLIYGDSI